jgi:DNA-binding transcriptional MerR regulator
MMPDNIPQLVTLLAVARALCVSPHTVRSWVRQGKLTPVRVCRRLLFSPDDIERFLVQAQTRPTGEAAQILSDGNQHRADPRLESFAK